ncbi:putative rosmarinate synthase [Medicago truncatula]|uniref:Putative rosmarinate synthase n=1 Tax=Medicago truncatula TaxID=3880 RepID=A0A396HKC3_MEDTR|nr:putative rosmarinate synthase [Medicago truncatula]
MDHVHCNVGSQIVAVTSVSPAKITEPRQVCQILFNDETKRTIEGCYQMVLYYEKVEEEDHDWSLTGWIVESLARALLDHPLLAGRVQKRDITGLEIVSNDSGIRLLEAHYPTSLSEFLESNKNEHDDDHEARLVFWNEIDGQFPLFSPLFYVTNFKCGGYSIGICCSLLLAEVLVNQKFLNKWVQIHNMLPTTSKEEINTSIFNYPRLKNHNFLSSEDLINHTQNKNRVQSIVFKITTKNVKFSKELWRELAMFCIEEVEQKLDTKIGSSFTLVVKESLEVIEVESVTKSGYTLNELGIKNQINCIASWNDFGVYEVVFHEENKPVHVSCWIGSVADARVMIVPCLEEENACFVTVASPR